MIVSKAKRGEEYLLFPLILFWKQPTNSSFESSPKANFFSSVETILPSNQIFGRILLTQVPLLNKYLGHKRIPRAVIETSRDGQEERGRKDTDDGKERNIVRL